MMEFPMRRCPPGNSPTKKITPFESQNESFYRANAYIYAKSHNEVRIIAYKERTKPKLLRIYEVLSTRMSLDWENQQYYLNHQKGFEGEGVLDESTETLPPGCLVLNDLLLEHRNSFFQIDALLVCADTLVLLEAKNYEGVHYWGAEKFTKSTGTVLENPYLQLQKSKVKLEILLQSLSCRMKVEAYVVYVNPEFILLQAQNNDNYILPSQIHSYLRTLKLNSQPNAEQKRIADVLVRLHKQDYPATKLPVYQYEHLRKGLSCFSCNALMTSFIGHYMHCPACGERMNVKRLIKNGIDDFRILFPEQKVTTNRLSDWCGSGDKDRIYRVLKENYQAKGNNHGRHYV